MWGLVIAFCIGSAIVAAIPFVLMALGVELPCEEIEEHKRALAEDDRHQEILDAIRGVEAPVETFWEANSDDTPVRVYDGVTGLVGGQNEKS